MRVKKVTERRSKDDRVDSISFLFDLLERAKKATLWTKLRRAVKWSIGIRVGQYVHRVKTFIRLPRLRRQVPKWGATYGKVMEGATAAFAKFTKVLAGINRKLRRVYMVAISWELRNKMNSRTVGQLIHLHEYIKNYKGGATNGNTQNKLYRRPSDKVQRVGGRQVSGTTSSN